MNPRKRAADTLGHSGHTSMISSKEHFQGIPEHCTELANMAAELQKAKNGLI